MNEASERADTPKVRSLEAMQCERAETIRKLRSVCAEFGDNDWQDDLHLADIIDKHLWLHLLEED